MKRAGYWFAAAMMAAGAGAAAPARAAPPQPKLIVAIAVDQFSAELFQRYRAGFPGGPKGLTDGTPSPAYQTPAATEPCPGHSTTLTARPPAATGIVANTWFDAKSGS